MLVSFEGRMGQGKSAAATALGTVEHQMNGRRLYSTYHLHSTVNCAYCPQIQIPISPYKIVAPMHRVYEDAYYYCDLEGGVGFPDTGVKKRLLTDEDEVNWIEYEFMGLEKFYDLTREVDSGRLELSGCIFILDESYLFMSSRTSGSKINRLFNSFTFQTRKRGVDMYLTTHDYLRLDKWTRQALDLRISCRFSPLNAVITLRIRDMHTGTRRRLRLHGPTTAFPYYDSAEIVKPQGKLYRLTAEEMR